MKLDWKDILVQLLIVFIGVYGAFLLNNYQQQQKEDNTKVRYYKTFLNNLKYMDQQAKSLKKTLNKAINTRGKTDSLNLVYNRDLDFTNTFYILKAAYSEQNFSSIKAQFLINIKFGANLIKQIEKRLEIIDREMRNYRIHQSDMSRTNKKNFKQWYKNELKFILGLISKLIKIIEQGAIPGTKAMLNGH